MNKALLNILTTIAVHKLFRNNTMKIKISTTVYHIPVNWGTGIPYGLPPIFV